MKTQTKQPEYSVPEVKAKIRKYNWIKNGFVVLSVAGFISGIGSIPVFKEYTNPEIAETYQNAQTKIQELQNKRKNLSDMLINFTSKTPKVKKLGKRFKRIYNETISGGDEAIESVQVKISEIESNPEFKQYQQDKKTKERGFICFYFGGLLTFIGGVTGGIIFNEKKTKFKKKIQKK